MSSQSLPDSPSPTQGMMMADTASAGSGSSSLSPAVNGVIGSSREPDSDAIKMFVGQIPRDWSEDECRALFSEFWRHLLSKRLERQVKWSVQRLLFRDLLFKKICS